MLSIARVVLDYRASGPGRNARGGARRECGVDRVCPGAPWSDARVGGRRGGDGGRVRTHPSPSENRSVRMATTKATTLKTISAAPKAAAKPKAAKESEQRLLQARRASILLKHVSDPTRLQVILILAEGERHVGALCEHLSQSQPAVSHHLALLRHGGIIAPRRAGKNNFYSLTDVGAELSKVVATLVV